MSVRILFFSLVLFLFASCVSPLVVSDLEEKQATLASENNVLKNENISLKNNNLELNDLIQRANKEIKKLTEDSVASHLEIKTLKSNYKELEDAYDLLLDKNSQVMGQKALEAKKLLAQLQSSKEDLQAKEDQLAIISSDLENKKKALQNTQSELEQRELKVKELQQLINRKDSVMFALKTKISKALLGFEGDGLSITQKNGKVYISLEEQLLFESGSWQIDNRGLEALTKLSKTLANQEDIDVLIEGHTDSIPFNGRGQIKDNWDLSVVRATAIVKTITSTSNISPSRLTAGGRGEYAPISTNKTRESRSINRRIEIILTPRLDDLFDLLEN